MGWFSRKSVPKTSPTRDEAATRIAQNFSVSQSNKRLGAFKDAVAGAQEQLRTDKVGANRALTKATEGRLQRWGRQAKDAVWGSEGKTLERNLDKNLSAAQTRFDTAGASHTQASDAVKELGEAQYKSNFLQRNETHDKALTGSYAKVLRTAQESKAAATFAEKTASVASKVALASTATGVGVSGGVVAGAVSLGANLAGAGLSGASAGAFSKTSSLAREEASNPTTTGTSETIEPKLALENKKGFHEEFAAHASDEARSRAVHATSSLISVGTGIGGDDLSTEVKSAATLAGMALGKVDKRIGSNSEDHFQKAADYGRADLREVDDAASSIIGRSYRNKKANTLFTALQDGAQKAGQERLEALDKIGAGFAKARKTNRSNRLFTALREGAQKAGEEGLEAKNKADQEHLQQLSVRFDADSGGKTVGARFNEYFFNKKSTHTQLGESLRTAAAATNQEDRGAAVSEVAKHSSAWQGRNPKSQGSSRGKAIGTLQEGIAGHMPGQPK